MGEINGTTLWDGRQPWRDKAGMMLSDPELRFVSRSWSRATWEAYLKSLETNRTEHLSPKLAKIVYANDVKVSLDNYWSQGESRKFSHFDRLSKEHVLRAVSRLTPKEQNAIAAVFYDNLSQTETARLMNISRMSVSRLLKRAFRKLERDLGAAISKANKSRSQGGVTK